MTREGPARRDAPGHAHGDADDHAYGHAHGHAHEEWERRYGRLVAERDHAPMMERPRTFWGRVRQFLWGFLFFDWYHELQHERAKFNDVFNLIIFGELIGIPLMNSAIGLRLLPYALPELPAWKHRQLEEFDLIEHGPHIH